MFRTLFQMIWPGLLLGISLAIVNVCQRGRTLPYPEFIPHLLGIALLAYLSSWPASMEFFDTAFAEKHLGTLAPTWSGWGFRYAVFLTLNFFVMCVVWAVFQLALEDD